MKLRIQGNSIRLRLTQAEVQRIAGGETVQEQVSFVPPFVYSLVPDSEKVKLAARYEDHTLRVSLPSALAHTWATSEQVSIEETLMLENGNELHVLIEKDFQCLHRRPNEDERDHFPNPAATPE